MSGTFIAKNETYQTKVTISPDSRNAVNIWAPRITDDEGYPTSATGVNVIELSIADTGSGHRNQGVLMLQDSEQEKRLTFSPEGIAFKKNNDSVLWTTEEMIDNVRRIKPFMTVHNTNKWNSGFGLGSYTIEYVHQDVDYYMTDVAPADAVLDLRLHALDNQEIDIQKGLYNGRTITIHGYNGLCLVGGTLNQDDGSNIFVLKNVGFGQGSGVYCVKMGSASNYVYTNWGKSNRKTTISDYVIRLMYMDGSWWEI